MDLFERLANATYEAQNLNELPDFLAERILRIAVNPDIYGRYGQELEELRYQVEQYDTYGQTGYMGMGVNNVVLEGTISKLEKKAGLMASLFKF